MPGENDKIKKLYDTFVSDGYDMESEEDFRKNLSDSTKRKAAYDALVNDGYDMEPFEDFEKNIGFGNKIEYLLKEPVFERDSSKVYSQIAQQHVLQANSAIKQTEEQIDKQAPVSTPANVSVNGKLRQAVKERDEISSMLAARGEELRKEYEDKSIFQKILTGIQHAEGGYHDNALETTKDDKYMKLSAALRQKNEQIAELENQKAREQGDSGFWRSFGKTVADPYTWLQAPKIADAVAMAGAKSGASEEDDILLQSTFENQQTQAEYAGNADFWERAGMMTGHMPAFMIDFMATGGGFKGMNALSKLGTKLATKAVGKEVAEQVAKDGILSYIKNNGVKGLGRFATDWTIKALGTTADDLLIRAPLMTNTVQAASTASDIIERKLGNVEQNEDGTYSFGNDKGLGDAIWQGEANAIIENYSEMFGAHLDPVLSLKNVAKLADVIGAKKIGKVLAKASASELGGIMGKTNELFNQMGVSDYFGEVSEEYYGQLWRTMLNLDDAYQQNADGTRTNLFNTGQFHGDILGGMALSMGMMGAGKTSVTAINYASMKHGVNKADARASEILGKDTWEQMKETIDLTTNEEIGDIAVGIVNDKDLSNEGKAAALDYLERSMKFRGFNLATVAQKRSEKVDEASEELNESYMDGYNAVEQQEMNDAKNMYDYQRERMKEELGVNDGALDDDVVDWMNELKNAIDSGTELGRKRAEVILDFLNAKAVKDGMMQRVRDDIDSRVGQSNAIINSRVNKSTGMIQGATMKNNDRKVYVVAGNVKQYDDKSGVDNNASDKTIIIKDAETGKFEQVSPESIFNVDDTIDPEQEKLTAAEAIRQQFAQEAANKIDGVVAFNPGDKYTITGDDGQAEVTVVANEQGIVDNGDGTINVTRDGKEVFPLSKDVIQQQVDEANRARVRQFDEERRVKNGESNAAMVEMNDQITFLDEGGNEVSGVVQSVGDDGVVVEVGGTDADLGKPTQFKAEDLYGRLTSISRGGNVMWQKEAEENREATEQPNKEQPPMNSASSKVPTDEQGRLVYEEAEPGIAWDALVEQTGGEEDIAAEIANDIIKEQEQALKNAEKELKKLQESKPKASGKPMSIEERIAAKKAEKVALEEAQKRIDTANQNIAKWKQIADTKALRQREAEAAEEKAAALKAEQEKAEQMEREVLNGVPDIVDDTPQAGEIKATSMFQYFTGTLSELIAQAKQSAQGLIKKVIAPISSRLKNDLNSQGLQIDDDYNHVIDNNAIRHTLKKHSGKNEEKRGQIPITDADFENIADVVEHYDGVEVVSGNTSAQRIIYHKSYQDGTVIFVEEQRVGRKELAAVTMWKKKNPNLTDANRTETTLISDLTEVSDNKDTNNSIKSSELGEKIAKAEAEVDVNPTDKQKEAGNYKKGHVQVGVFDITIEQPKGSVRSGVDANGNKWETTMQNTYGYIRGTEGVDGDHIDVFLSDDIDGWNGRRVFVVDQYNEDGSFDEHKVMLGFNETDDAEAAYFANYDNDWAKKHKTVVTGVNLEDFEKWIDSSHRKTKAFAEYKSVKSVEEQSSSTQVNRLSEIKSRIEELHKEQEAAHGQSDIFEEARIISEINDLFTEQRKLEQNNSNEETTTPTDAAYTITPAQYTTKRGKVLDMHLVKFNDELRDTVRKHTTMFAKQLKGWWDKEKQGFMMRSKEDAERLAEYATDAQLQQPVSMSDMQALNDGNVQFVEPQLSETSKPEERQEYTPVWQYSVSVDKKTGLTTLRRDDVSGPIPIGDGRFNYTANSPEEMLEIVRNPKNFNQELRDAVETILENKVKIREIVREEKAAAAKQEPKPGNNPSGNRLVTDERYEKLKKKMKLKIRGQMNMGIDPEILAIGTEMAVYHIEKGSRKFAEYATAMIADLGDAIRPYLKAFYNGARDLPEVAENGLDADMTPYDEVQKFDVANFDKTSIDALATAETITREAEVEQEAEIAQERIKKSRPARKKNEKKAVNSQQSNELGLFDGLTDNNKNSEHGLQRADAELHRQFAMTVKADMLAALDNGTKPYRSILDLRKRASELGMEVDNDGRTDILLQELVEDGLVRAAREVVSSKGRDSRASYDLICKLYEMQPTIAARSSNRIKMQQYSTPLPMAWIANRFAMANKADGKVLEPTAGNGMLVFTVPVEQVRANELDETRLDNLREQGFAEVTQQDATEPFEGGMQYDVVIANPPFGKREAVEYDGKMIPGLDPQITLNALASMKDDGRAAIIIGGNMEYASNGAIKSMKPFFTYLYDHYNVKGVIDMSGGLYAKQGTTFPTRMILIDGRRSNEERAQTAVYPPVESKAIRKAESFDDLYEIINEVLNSKEKTNGTEVLRSQGGRHLSVADNASGETDGAGHNRQSEANDESGSQTERRGRTGLERNSESGQRPVLGERGQNDTVGETGRGTDTIGESSTDRRRLEQRTVGNGTQPVDGVDVQRSGLGLSEEPKKRDLTEEKLPYRPHNTAFRLESVAPAAMVEAMDNVLTQIEAQHGSIDEFIKTELGYDTIEEAHQALAAEQMDSVAMAIYQMKQGQALIIGDQTGVGKGRQMAALIRWAVQRGEKPVFITQKADLFSDIYRDLVDIGSGDLVPFIFNSPSAKENKGEMVDANGKVVYKGLSDSKMKKVMVTGKLPEDCDFAVLTYSQVNTGDAVSQQEMEEAAQKSGARTKKSKNVKNGKDTPKATFLRSIAKDNYLFLDESHTAAGSSNTGAYLQSILRGAKAATFASATFAKRPDTMPLYAIRTAMSQAKVEPNKMISIIEKGGVTLQEIMSRELTNAGQMVRRERDMSDVVTDWKTITDPETVRRARENYDRTIAAFNAIIKFQEDYVKPMIEALDMELAVMAESAGVKRGTDKMGVENVPFASKTYNYTKQLMLALKVDAIADEVEAEINAGRHPVIALESTMESSIKDYAAGETIDEPTFSASLLKGLDSVMQYTVKDEDGNERHERYSPQALGPAGEKAYYELQDFIHESTSDIFISPLDAIIERLNDKGYKVGELTGRNMYVERNDDGRVVVKRRTDKDKKKMQREFNSGVLDVLILNKSASTGISLHASEKFSDQRQRSMIIAQPLSDINDYMQMIGRIDRTGQVHRGYYINLGLPVPAENRFLMMLSTKLKSLNANTTTSQDSESNDVEAPDLLNKYGSQVVVEYLRDNVEIYEKMGAPLKKGGPGGGLVQASELDEYKPQEDDARKITGYVALLTTKEQEEFYDDVVRRYNELIKYLNDTGSNDLKITVMPLHAKTIEKRVSSEGIDPDGNNPFARNSFVEKVEMDVLRKPMKADEIRKVIEQINRGASPAEYLESVIERIRNEDEARIAAEEERYEKAKAKAVEDIAKQTDKINGQKKRSDEEKRVAIENFIAETNEKVENKHNDNIVRLNQSSDQIMRRLRMFEVGKSYLVPDNLEAMVFDFATPAIFCGYKTKDSKITSSTTLAVFATLDGRRRIEIKLSQIDALRSIDKMTNDNWDAARATTLDNWDSQIPSETRKTGFIMTGNILQAIADTQDEYGGYPGQLISYTDIDGNVHDGILMPDKWNASMLKTSGAPLSSRLQQIKDYTPIISHDGKVEIMGSSWAKMFYLTVPKTKKDGAVYYENKTLLRAAGGNFYPYRGKLRADIPAGHIDEVVKELTKLGVKVKDDTTDILQRNGIGAYTDDEVSYENDPVAKLLGRSRRTAKQRREFAQRERQRMVDKVESLAEKLHLDNVEIVTDASTLEGEKQRAKGFYSKSTGKITIVVPNHASVFDIEQTLLHEAVAHYGLRKLFGSHFDTFLDNVFNNAEESIRRHIVDMAVIKYGWDFRKATEEYLAGLAERTDFNDINASWWRQIKKFFLDMLHKIGFEDFRVTTLTDNELRYILWRSYKNLTDPGMYRSILGEAEDIAKQYELKVGNYAEKGVVTEDRVADVELSRATNIVKNFENPDLKEINNSEEEELFRDGDPVDDAHAIYEEAVKDTGEACMAEAIIRSIKDKDIRKRFKNKFAESYFDYSRSVKALQDAIAKATGKAIQSFENAWQALNAKSSVDSIELQRVKALYIDPLNEHIGKMIKDKKLYDKKLNIDDVEIYLNAKHGPERNHRMADEDAEQRAIDKNGGFMEKPIDTESEDYQDRLDKWEEWRKDVDKEKERLLEKRRDYSGLTALFEKQVEDKRDVEELEDAARDYCEAFETVVGKDMADELHRLVKALNEWSLKKAYMSGLLSNEQYNRVNGMYDYYVPLRGWHDNYAGDVYEYISNGADTSTLQSVMRHAYGRKSRAGHILGTMASMANLAIVQGNKNLVAQKFMNCALNHNDSGLLMASKQWYERTKDGDMVPVYPDFISGNPEHVRNISAEEMQESIERYDAEMQARSKTDTKLVSSKFSKEFPHKMAKWQENQHSVRVMRNGVEYRVYVLGNPKAAQALNGLLNPDSKVGIIGKYMMKWLRFRAQMQTSFSPFFLVGNFQRDIVTAGTSMYIKHGAKIGRQFANHLCKLMPVGSLTKDGDTLKGAGIFTLIRRYDKGSLDMTDEMQRYFKEFCDNGGITGISSITKNEEFENQLKDVVRRIRHKNLNMPRDAAEKFFGCVEFLNKGIENATRFSVYMTMRQAGKSVGDAVFEAKDASVNFNMKGSGAWLNLWMRRYILYSNVALQALYKLGNLYDANPKRFYIAMSTPMLVSFATAMLCHLIGGDDDDDEGKWYGLSQWNRYNYINIPTGKGYLHYSIPQEFRPSWSLGQIIYDWQADRITKEAALQSMLTQLNNISPMAFIAGGVDSGDDYIDGFVKAWTPTIAADFMDVYHWNQDFLGRSITNQREWNKTEPEWQRAGKDTPQWAIEMSKMWSDATGGRAHWRSSLDNKYINPSALYYLFKQQLGGVGEFITKTSNMIEQIQDPETELELRNIPFVSKFYVETGDDVSKNRVTNDKFRMYWSEFKAIDSEIRKNRSDYKNGKITEEELKVRDSVLTETGDMSRWNTLISYSRLYDQLIKESRDGSEKAKKELQNLKRSVVKLLEDGENERK